MSDKCPTRVVLYSMVAGEPGKPTPIAEFHWSPEGGVTLVELNPNWTLVARELYSHGVESYRKGRVVHRSEGPEFMRSLLDSMRNSTYYGIMDKSED